MVLEPWRVRTFPRTLVFTQVTLFLGIVKKFFTTRITSVLADLAVLDPMGFKVPLVWIIVRAVWTLKRFSCVEFCMLG